VASRATFITATVYHSQLLVSQPVSDWKLFGMVAPKGGNQRYGPDWGRHHLKIANEQ